MDFYFKEKKMVFYVQHSSNYTVIDIEIDIETKYCCIYDIKFFIELPISLIHAKAVIVYNNEDLSQIPTNCYITMLVK